MLTIMHFTYCWSSNYPSKYLFFTFVEGLNAIVAFNNYLNFLYIERIRLLYSDLCSYINAWLHQETMPMLTAILSLVQVWHVAKAQVLKRFVLFRFDTGKE